MQVGNSAPASRASNGVRRPSVQPFWALISVLLLLIAATLASLQAPHPNPIEPLSQRSWADLLRYPIELHATRRLQVAPGAMNGVAMPSDGRLGWAVGTGGTILATSDGGRSWAAQTSGVQAELLSVQFSADALRGWAVGTGGTILATADGGRSWAAQTSGVQAELLSVQFSADGLRGWAVGTGGAILATADGGRNWAAQTSGVQAELRSVQFSADGLRGWAVGTGGAILATTDGGTRWQPIVSAKVGSARLAVGIADSSGLNVWAVGYPPALLHSADGGQTWSIEAWPLRYSRYPAPWFWLSLIAVVLCWRRSLRLAPDAREQGAEAMVATDAPTKDFTQDRLRFAPLAKGISRFLRNASTEPPLTLAVSGDWGSGKSSLMGLVCSDLRRHGSRPVWFNAWHHQRDDQLLAALLNAVRGQGLPTSLTPDGWIFRLRLLWLRSKKHFVLAFVTVVAVTAMFAFLMTHNTDAWSKLWANLGKQLPWLEAAAAGKVNSLSTADLGKLLAQLVSGITVLVALRKALTAFGADPAVLLSATAEQFRLKDASALTSFRARFADQFDEVTKCLPYRMVIVIDDLDRCSPEAVLEVMEAVNFLVSSGSCFVIFGMATHRVQAALAVSFEKIASESVELAIGPGETPTPAEKERMERERRRRYARDYMEKLVNLEIVVPTGEATEPHLLLEPSFDEAGALRPAVASLVSLWPLALLAAAILAGWHLGARWQFSDLVPQPVLQMGVLAPSTAASAVAADAPARRASDAASAVAPLYPVPTVQPGDEREIPIYAFAVPIGLLASWAAGFALFRLRSNLYQVKDSQAFRESLRTWMPLIQQHRRTPRALKRFGNRIRYLAMLQQAERFDESRWDALSAVFAAWRRRLSGAATVKAEAAEVVPAAENESGIGEDTIVALGALYEVSGPGWRNCLAGEFPSEVQEAALKAIELHRRLGEGTHWPPTAAELDSFERSLQGIRVPSA